MYGLKQAAILAYQQLKKVMKPFGYEPVPGTAGMWKHVSRKTVFCTCVDDFAVKYFSKDDANHFLQALTSKYKYTMDWTGSEYCGLHMDWEYKKGYVDVSMPGFVQKSLKKLNYKGKIYPQNSPHNCSASYSKPGTTQYAPPPDNTTPLQGKQVTYVQSVVGTFLYYGRAIDYAILPAINDISSEQSKPTKKTLQKIQRLMDYVNTHDNAFLRFHASDMVLHVDSDAAYLVAPKARSRIAGYYHLTDNPKKERHNHY